MNLLHINQDICINVSICVIHSIPASVKRTAIYSMYSDNMHCTVYTFAYTIHRRICHTFATVYGLFVPHSTVYSVRRTLYGVQCTPYIVHDGLLAKRGAASLKSRFVTVVLKGDVL